MSQSTSSPEATQGRADWQITKYCCFLRKGTAHGCGFIVEFQGVQSANLLALDWEKRRKIGKLETDYALITSHDTIPGSSPSDLNDWKVSCEGIKNGNEQTLSNLVCGVISCCGPETLFAGHSSDANVFRSHHGNACCDIQLNIAILFLNSTFEKLLQGSTVFPLIPVNVYLQQESYTQEHKQIVNSGGELEVYYCDKTQNVESTAVSLAEREGISKQSTAAVSAEQQNASVHEQVLRHELIEFERLQKLELVHSTTEIGHGSPVVYLNPAINEPSIIGVYVGKTKQDTVVTLHGILRLLQGGLVPVLSALQCLDIPHAWVSRWGYLVTPHIKQLKEMKSGYVCEVLDFLLRKRYGTPLVLLSVDLVEVDNEASLDLLCALFKHFESADVNEAVTTLNLENQINAYIIQLCNDVINLLKMGDIMVTDRTCLVEWCCTFYNLLLIKFAGITKQILYTSENLELLKKIRLRYIKSEVVQGSTSDISSNCSLLETLENQAHYQAYQQALKEDIAIPLKYLKVLFFGPPRTGKTSMRRRLVGEIENLKNEPFQASTDTAKLYDVIVKVVEDKTTTSTAVITKSEWSSVKALFGKEKRTHETDLDDELQLLYQFIYQAAPPVKKKSVPSSINTKETKAEPTKAKSQTVEAQSRVKTDTVSSSLPVGSPKITSSHQQMPQFESEYDEDIEKAYKAFTRVICTGGQEQLKVLLKGTILMNMVDTGGQPAFLEMLPSLTMGPALYLIFFRLNQELKKTYWIQYVSKNNEGVQLGESSYTVEEVIFQALSSIACFSCTAPKKANMPNPSHAAMLIGTHKDLLGSDPEAEIKDKDDALQKEISVADLFKAGKKFKFLRYASEDQLMFAVDNMNGDKKELTKVHKRLENIMKNCFDKFPIPASWLMFSIFLRRISKMGNHTLSLSQCHQIGDRLKVKDTDEALWFLHHHVGTLMHFPKVEEIKDIVICDPQVVFDSVSDLILNSFTFNHVDKLPSENFKRTGQFSLEDIQKTAKRLKCDILPQLKLLKLLEHLNIIAPIKSDGSSPQSDAYQEEVIYFMPAVLEHATEEELHMEQSPTDPVPLMIHFKCGFVPVGVFCAMIASLVAQEDTLGWILQVPRNGHNLYKNKVTFRINGAFNITLISKPKQYEIYIACTSTTDRALEEICQHVLETVCDILDQVISKMKYKQLVSSPSDQTLYELGFKCPKHLNDDHLVINKPIGGVKPRPSQSATSLWSNYLATQRNSTMICLREGISINIRLSPSFAQQSLVWFGEATEISSALSAKEASHDVQSHGSKGDQAKMELNDRNILNVLHDAEFADAHWELLGEQLIKRPALLNTRANRQGEACLCMIDTIAQWLRTDTEASWEKLAVAVSKVEQYGEATANIVRKKAGIATVEKLPSQLPTHQLQCTQPQLLSVKKEIEQLQKKYEVLTGDVLEAFKRGNLPVEEVRTCIRQLPEPLKHQCSEFILNQASRLSQASSIDELFWILSNYWDFLNPDLLVHLTNRFGDGQAKASVDIYMEELRGFRKQTKLKDFINQWTSSGTRHDFHKIGVVLKDEWKECNLEDLEEFRDKLSLKQWLMLRFDGIVEGSMAAMFSFPKTADLELESLHGFFQKYQILRVFLNGACIVNLQEADGAMVQTVTERESTFHTEPMALAGSDKVKHLNVQTESVEIKHQHVQAKAISREQISIRGADNVGEITLKVVPGEPLNYYWEGHGLRLHIPADALDPSTPPLTMRIQASISGQFRLPDDMDLVSGVYWISFPARVLKQPVTLELQHCAYLEQTEQTYLSFVTSKCNQPLPYQFKPLSGGVFTTSSDYGTVQLKHFSGLAVAKKKRRRTQSHSRKQEGDTDSKHAAQRVEKKYLVLTYFTQARATRTTWKMHFTIIPNLDLHLKRVEKYYSKEEAESSLHLQVVFQMDQVTLDIPEAGFKLPNGWSIVPMAHPASVMQTDVDSYDNSTPPSCQLEVHFQRTEQPYERLSHQVKVNGIRGISTITITRDVDPELRAVADILGKRNYELESEGTLAMKRLKSDDLETQEGTETLDIENLRDITSYLNPLNKTAIINLGIVLGLNYNRLNTIVDSQTFLNEMLAGWLQGVDKAGVPTWKRLVEALKDPRVGQNGIASKIEKDKQGS